MDECAFILRCVRYMSACMTAVVLLAAVSPSVILHERVCVSVCQAAHMLSGP